MSDVNEKLYSTKDKLMAVLGDNAPKYLANMKLWFRHKWTKAEFDRECRKLLTPNIMELHNQFLIAILVKIDAYQVPRQLTPTFSSSGGGSSSRSRKKKRRTLPYERTTFEPYDLFEFLNDECMTSIRPPVGVDTPNGQILPTQRYCVQELFLPDTSFVMGRFLIGAWELGIAGVDDSVPEYIAMAVQNLLKNLISAIIMKRKHYKVTSEGSYYYDVGAELKDPSVRNTVTRQKIDDAPLDLDKELTSPNFNRRSNDDGTFLSACEEVYPQEKTIITLKDAQRALTDRNLIASHTVYSVNMERLTQMMHS